MNQSAIHSLWPYGSAMVESFLQVEVEGNFWLFLYRNHSGLLGTGKLGIRNFIFNTYSLHFHHQNDSALRWAAVSHFNVSLIVWAKSQDSVHKPQFLKRKESGNGSNRCPSAYQSRALPLGHTGSQVRVPCTAYFVSLKSFTLTFVCERWALL